ncbi:MAG: dTDP-glucose 4,6-dehydratase [Candidatus Eremiobacteraeota bacterium]|nr:dTDP-glucose 4,6-dehydratase [Candidatus Eremiobacteraeota bacterium]MBC5823940.1 dTDP-glucose 4,6-dehydratase [Candidatus Eremiobacteraeota bacterium]
MKPLKSIVEPGYKRWLVTGGLGFIGSHFIRLVLGAGRAVSVVNLDAMTYAGNGANLADMSNHPSYRFLRGNICDEADVDRAIGDGVDAIINFAAESHVDRSIIAPSEFLRTDIMGTHVLLEAARRHKVSRFLQVSTDEVYGHIASGHAKETDCLAPRSPYAASKAGADLQALAYANTYGIPVLITRGTNTYGPYQYPEKLIPLFVTNLLEDKPVPVYGDGDQVREWMHVEDHAEGVLHILERGVAGHVYNLSAGNARTNLEITRRLVQLCGRSLEAHVRYVQDRPGHDRRYAIDASKARRLGWRPKVEFAQGLTATVDWFRTHERWWREIKNGAFQKYYREQYEQRLAP